MDPMVDRVPPAGSSMTAALWTGVLLAPVAWAFHLSTGYALASVRCEGGIWPIHVATGLALLLAGAGMLVAWRTERRLGEHDETDADRLARRRFMARGGVFLSAFFIAVIVVQAAPALVLEPCR